MLVKMMSPRSKGEMLEIKTIFKRFDKDGSGKISSSELKEAFKQMGLKLSDEKVEEMIQECDKNRDGEIDMDEWIEMVKDAKSSTGGTTQLGKTMNQKKVFQNVTSTGTHSFSEEETDAFVDHINSVLSSDEDVNHVLPLEAGTDLFEAVKDGILLCKLINSSKSDTIDERVINKISSKKKKLNPWEKSENCTLCVNSATGIGVSTVNIGANDIIEGTPHIVLGIVWQIIKVGLLAEISLKDHPELIVLMEEGETVADMLKKNPEEILRRWFNYQLNKAGSDRRVKGFTDDIKDSECYTLVLNTITKGKASKDPLNESDPEKRAAAMLKEAEKCEVAKFVSPKTIVKPNPKLNLAFVANLFNTYPNLEMVDTSDFAELLDFDEEGTREERAFRFWIQSMGIDCNNLFDDLKNGVVLLKVEDKIQPGIVEWKKVNDPPKLSFHMLENNKKVIDNAKTLKLSTVNMGANDIMEGNKKIILAIVWQLMRKNIVNILAGLSGDGKEITDNDIIEWANGLVNGTKIDSFKDKSIGSGVFLCELCAAVKPDAVNKDFITPGESPEDAEKNAKYAISVARKLNATVFLLWEDIVEVKPKMIMTFVASMMEVAQKK
eukprot:gene10188-2607_t